MGARPGGDVAVGVAADDLRLLRRQGADGRQTFGRLRAEGHQIAQDPGLVGAAGGLQVGQHRLQCGQVPVNVRKHSQAHHDRLL